MPCADAICRTLTAVTKLNLDIEVIATAHGASWRGKVQWNVFLGSKFLPANLNNHVGEIQLVLFLSSLDTLYDSILHTTQYVEMRDNLSLFQYIPEVIKAYSFWAHNKVVPKVREGLFLFFFSCNYI